MHGACACLLPLVPIYACNAQVPLMSGPKPTLLRSPRQRSSSCIMHRAVYGEQADMQASKHAGMLAGMHACRQACKQADRQACRQADKQLSMQASRHACRQASWCAASSTSSSGTTASRLHGTSGTSDRRTRSLIGVSIMFFPRDSTRSRPCAHQNASLGRLLRVLVAHEREG